MKKLLLANGVALAIFGMTAPGAFADGGGMGGNGNHYGWGHGGDECGGGNGGSDPVLCDIETEDLEIKGYIECECELDIDNAYITLFEGASVESDTEVATITAGCNTKDGFNVKLTSANGGLLLDGHDDLVAYTLEMGAVSFSPTMAGESMDVDVAYADAFAASAVTVSADATGAFAGHYADVVTVEIGGIL